jgi:hypothetical protein
LVAVVVAAQFHTEQQYRRVPDELELQMHLQLYHALLKDHHLEYDI